MDGERKREGGEERELYLDHGLTVDFNNFVQPLQSKRIKHSEKLIAGVAVYYITHLS